MKIGNVFCVQIIHVDEISMTNGGPIGDKETQTFYGD